jgi:hypothetical protein
MVAHCIRRSVTQPLSERTYVLIKSSSALLYLTNEKEMRYRKRKIMIASPLNAAA